MTAWYVALLALILAAVGVFLVVELRTDLLAGTDGRLKLAVDEIAIGYHAEGSPEAVDVSSTVLSGEGAASQVLTSARQVTVTYGDRVVQTPMLAAAELHAVLAGRRVQRTAVFNSQRFRIVARATTRRGQPRAVVAAESMTTIDRSVHRLLVLLLIACPAALAATAAGGWWPARRSLQPIDQLTTQAGGIGIERLARADRGALDLQLRLVDLSSVAEERLERLRALAQAREVTLDAELLPAPVRGDWAWLGRAIANLIDNAIKFSPAGPTVTITTEADADEARLRVLDEGPGIPSDARELVFDRFRRLDPSRTRSTGGTGIGLAIVREIARLHGGRVWTESGATGGSLFTLALPVAVPSESAAAVDARSS